MAVRGAPLRGDSSADYVRRAESEGISEQMGFNPNQARADNFSMDDELLNNQEHYDLQSNQDNYGDLNLNS